MVKKDVAEKSKSGNADRRKTRLSNPLFIGVCGGSATGKTTICGELANLFGDQIQVISQDSYYLDRTNLSDEEISQVNFDHPDSVDMPRLYRDVKALKVKGEIRSPQYCFKTRSVLKEKRVLKIKKINLVEGLYVFRNEELRDFFDLRIYVHAAEDVREQRRIQRDIAHRGRDFEFVLEQYLTTVLPMHKRYVEKQKIYADYILDTTDPDESSSGFTMLVSKLMALIS